MGIPPVIEGTNLTIGYGPEVILSKVDIVIQDRVLMPFIGPNGAGKSTILKAFLGLLPLRSGNLVCRFGDIAPSYVPQQKHLDPLYPVSVAKIVTMGLYPELGFWKRPNKEQRGRLYEALDRFDLRPHKDKTFSELSGGMRQKTLLARAIVSGSRVLILDEPTAGLDAISEREVLKYLVELQQQEGKTILLAHHRLEDLSHLTDTVCLVDQEMTQFLPSSVAWNKMRGAAWENNE
ncbi:MAG: ATP-binding cassette domain-containing protein [Desulfobulbaceae bacterium]|nr:ATP-binding cassette domain-containing protein [Desulfobulbaceae bacterium]